MRMLKGLEEFQLFLEILFYVDSKFWNKFNFSIRKSGSENKARRIGKKKGREEGRKEGDEGNKKAKK
jgi:hypothetical protein